MAKKKKYDSENGIWRTIGGRRVFIRKGQDLSSAMKESGKFKTKMNEKAVKGVREEDLKDQYIESLNNVSKMEYNGEITRDEYDEAIKNINKEYKNRKIGDKFYTREDGTREYELYKRAKENPDSIDPMTENSTDWETLDKKYSNKYDRELLSRIGYKTKEEQDTILADREARTKRQIETDFHFAGEELYSDDPNRFGDKLRKYNNKMNPSKNDALNKVKNNRVVENVKSGDRFYEIGNGQWRSEKDGYDYYIDFNSSNIDNPKYRDVASGKIINTNPRADNYWDYEKTGVEKQMSRYKASDLSSRYRKTYEYLQETTNMNSSEILELLKRIDEDKK